MADIVSPEKRSQMMAAIRGQNTKPEIAIRKLLFAKGYRFRLHRKDLPGKPDIVLPKYKALIFVQGCFWHGHKDCALFRMPKSKQDFWRKKISGNVARDKANTARLLDAGWRICTVWECALKGRNRIDPEDIARNLIDWVESDEIDKVIRGKKPRL